MGTLIQDLRFGGRTLAKNPGFTIVAIVTLALGIGANTAIFSVVNAVLLRPLPYKDPGRLVLVTELLPKFSSQPLSLPAPDVVTYGKQNQAFTQVAGFQETSFDLAGGGQPERVMAARVSAALFPLLGIQPLLGRSFTPEEDRFGGNRVAVLSYGLWKGRFHADPQVVGKTITLDEQPYTVTGVMPRSFEFPLQGMAQGQPASLWVPMAFTPEELADVGDNFDYSTIARLKPSLTLARANADVKSIAYRILETYPAQMRGEIQLSAIALPLSTQVGGKVRTLLLILLGAVGLVLLIACVNVASLLLTRAASRQKEIAIRLAMGAGRLRLLRQMTTEGLLLALGGGAGGVFLALWGTEALSSFIPENIPRVHTIQVDLPVLAFTLVISVAAGLVFGLVPGLSSPEIRLQEALKEGGRSSTEGREHHRLRSALIVTEVALAIVLLVGAGLLLRSFQQALETDPGFQPERLLTASINLPATQYSKPEQLRAFYADLLRRLQAIPGVRAAGASTDLPLEGSWDHVFTPEGYQPGPNAPMNICWHSVILGDYLQTMGIPLIRGRYFTANDNPKSAPVVIISQSIARRFWPGQDPLGKRLKWGPPQSHDAWLTIVGVTGDVKQGDLDSPTLPHTYQPYLQINQSRSLHVALRAAGNPAALAGELRASVWSMDKQLAVAHLETMEQVISRSLTPRRFNMFLLTLFAALALVLAMIGIYGVISYSVGQRTHEIGIRMALGAERQDVMKMVIGQSMALTFAGIGIGLAAATLIGKVMASLLYGVRPLDLITFVAVPVLMAAVALLAIYIPARRASQVDPMVALRTE